MNEETLPSKPKLLITEADGKTQRFLEIFLRKKFDVSICDSAATFYEEIDKKNLI